MVDNIKTKLNHTHLGLAPPFTGLTPVPSGLVSFGKTEKPASLSAANPPPVLSESKKTHSQAGEALHLPDGRRRVGRYEIMFPLDLGGMASIYAGRLAGLAGFEKLVALKIVHPHLAGDEAYVRMFLDEARLAADVRHPNVAEIYEVGEDRGSYFMAMELVQGQSLNRLLAKVQSAGQNISPFVHAHIVSRICRGLHEAHELVDVDGRPLGLVHRDVSPHNILVSYKGEVKLIDFGIAWAKTRLTFTQTGTTKGKLGYIAPEAFRGKRLDRRSDVFALGVVLYVATTGRHPFPGESEAERVERIIKGRAVPVREAAPLIAPWLEEIIQKAMAREPEQRFATALAMAEALEQQTSKNNGQRGTAAIAALMQQHFATEEMTLKNRVREFRRRAASTEAQAEDAASGADSTLELFDGSVGPIPSRTTLMERVSESTKTTLVSRSAKRALLGMLGGIGFAAGIIFLGDVFAVLPFGLSELDGARSNRVAAATTAPKPDFVAKSAQSEVAANPAALAAEVARDAEESAVIHISLHKVTPKARVTLDGVRIEEGVQELALRRDGVTHTIEVSGVGYASRRFTFEADRDRAFEVELKKLPARSASEAGSRKQPAALPQLGKRLKFLSNPF